MSRLEQVASLSADWKVDLGNQKGPGAVLHTPNGDIEVTVETLETAELEGKGLTEDQVAAVVAVQPGF